MTRVICEVCKDEIKQQFHDNTVIEGGMCRNCVLIRMIASAVVFATLAFCVAAIVITGMA